MWGVYECLGVHICMCELCTCIYDVLGKCIQVHVFCAGN